MFNPSDIVLEAKHVVKQFPASDGRLLTACNDVTLNVYRGKTLGIVGESGCGKSTFVRMLTQMDTPTSGEILLHGKDILHLKGEERRLNRQNLQMVFQDPLASFNPKMKVMDILTEPLRNFGRLKRADREAKARELLRMVELPEDFVYRYPHSMSGGQRQRIGRKSWFATRPPAPWMCPFRRPSSSSWFGCSGKSKSASCSSATIWRWFSPSLTRLRLCIWDMLWR